MHIKYIFQGLLALVLASAAWYVVGPDFTGDSKAPSPARPPVVKFENDGPPASVMVAEATEAGPIDPIQPDANKRGLGGMRKCKKGSTMVYTDRPCPEGTQRKTIGGSMTVVSGVPQGF